MLNYYLSQLQSILYVIPGAMIAIILHECAHGWVSDQLGDPTPRASERLSLNPLKHFDLMGTICLLIFHMGWAKPVPINPRYYRDQKKGIILVSLAGPVTNFILAFLSLLIYGLTLLYAPADSSLWDTIILLVYYSAIINIGLGVFNLIPFPPLDGSHVLEELIPAVRRFYQRYQLYGSLILIVLLVSGALSRPLSYLDNAILNGMWRIIYLILIHLPTLPTGIL